VFEEHLQHLAERLARGLHRSVIIDDAALRPLAVSPQTGRLDRSRVEAVLQRGTSARLRRRLTEHGVFSAREPVPIPGDPGQAILPRLCLPLRDGDQLLGFLWLIDEPALTAGETAQAQATAAQAAHLLEQRAIRADGQFAVLSDLADGLLDDREEARQEAAAMLAGQEALTGPPPWAVAVIRLAGRAGPEQASGPSRATRVAATLRRAAANLRRRAAPGSLVVATPRESEFACITAAGARAELHRAVAALPGPLLATGTCAGPAALAEVAAGLENARYAAFVAAVSRRSAGPPTGPASAPTPPSSTSARTRRHRSGSAPASAPCWTRGPASTGRRCAATWTAPGRPSRPPGSCTSTARRSTGASPAPPGWCRWTCTRAATA